MQILGSEKNMGRTHQDKLKYRMLQIIPDQTQPLLSNLRSLEVLRSP